jgi:hypothetical protein
MRSYTSITTKTMGSTSMIHTYFVMHHSAILITRHEVFMLLRLSQNIDIIFLLIQKRENETNTFNMY